MDRAAFLGNLLRDFVSHLGFGVADDNIVVGNEENVCDFPFAAKDLPLPGVPKISPFGF